MALTLKHVPEAGRTPEWTEAAGPEARGLGSGSAPSLPSPPCPPLQRQDVRFCQVAHTYEVLGLVTTCCLCVIATQAPLVTPQAGREQSVLVVVRAAEVALCTAHGQGDEGGLHILPTGA